MWTVGRAGAQLVCLLVLGTVSGCSGGPGSVTTATVGSPTAVVQTQTAADTTADTTDTTDGTDRTDPTGAAEKIYVSIGDSYTTGFRPGDGSSTDGFPYRIEAMSRRTGHPVRLVNFGCSGATSTSMSEVIGCGVAALGPGATPYPDRSQAAAALDRIRENPAAVGLVTIIIGGNDVQSCVHGTAVEACVEAALPTLRDNVRELAREIRAAVGPDVPVVGLTYPDVYLPAAATGNPALADLSVEMFRSQLNPALATAYADAAAIFVDITQMTGAYGDMSRTTTLEPFGVLPEPVAQVCRLTYVCSGGDVHPTPAGHQLLAEAVLAAAFPE